MEDLTLVIPAKYESDSLPKVIEELQNYKYKVLVVLEKSDSETINSIKKFDITKIYQSKKGYGNAIREGIQNVKTEYICTYYADGSCDPKFLQDKLDLCKKDYDFIFSSRYLKNAGSDDDTLITKIGNFFFTIIGNIFFKLSISDILFTYVAGKTESFKKLDLSSDDFCLCVEIPIKAKKLNMKFRDYPSYERKRIAGFKKVKEFKDGFKILSFMFFEFFKKQ